MRTYDSPKKIKMVRTNTEWVALDKEKALSREKIC